MGIVNRRSNSNCHKPAAQLVTQLTNEDARKYFLQNSSYFNAALPNYLSFQTILEDVAKILDKQSYDQFLQSNSNKKSNNLSNCYRDANNSPDVNYKLLTNKDGRLAWRPLELIHPVIYVSLVNTICDKNHWNIIQERFIEFGKGDVVECCSIPVTKIWNQEGTAAQILNWWVTVEQRSIEYSLKFTHLLHTDVTNCYGSLYTHSIAWAIHGLLDAKERRTNKKLLGNKIDTLIRSGRHGQTNGIPQGSVLMDFIAEMVLGYVDLKITEKLKCRGIKNTKILRYRDDYRIFANSDQQAEDVLKTIHDSLHAVGMSLNTSKTVACRNVIEGSIKPDKLAGSDLQNLGINHSQTVQKQLLKLHKFGLQYPNSGALRRLISEFHIYLYNNLKKNPSLSELEVQIAITTDIAFLSPTTFPAVAGILSCLLSLASTEKRQALWTHIHEKMNKTPYNKYLEIWLQRITRIHPPSSISATFDEPICQIVNGKKLQLWLSTWLDNENLLKVCNDCKIVQSNNDKVSGIITPEEIQLFKQNALDY